MKSIINLILVAVLLLLSTEQMKAQSIGRKIEWQVAAITCTPTSKTINENKYTTTGGILSFKKEKTGQLIFTSPITKPLPAGKYRISGSVKASNIEESFNPQSINLSLRKKNIQTGAVETVLKTEFGKETLTNTKDYQTIYSNFPKVVQFNFSKFTYWLEVSMQRKKPSSHRVISSIQLVRQVG